MKTSCLKIVIIAALIFLALILFCWLPAVLPTAPKRSFSAADLLIAQNEVPPEWTVPTSPNRDTDTGKPEGAVWIYISTSKDVDGREITQRVAIYPNINGAKNNFSVTIQFPGETNVDGWSFISRHVSEEKFSCYTYSNLNYPTCRWVARYEEIVIHVIGRLRPGRLSLEEFQLVIETIDKKVSRLLGN